MKSVKTNKSSPICMGCVKHCILYKCKPNKCIKNTCSSYNTDRRNRVQILQTMLSSSRTDINWLEKHELWHLREFIKQET